MDRSPSTRPPHTCHARAWPEHPWFRGLDAAGEYTSAPPAPSRAMGPRHKAEDDSGGRRGMRLAIVRANCMPRHRLRSAFGAEPSHTCHARACPEHPWFSGLDAAGEYTSVPPAPSRAMGPRHPRHAPRASRAEDDKWRAKRNAADVASRRGAALPITGADLGKTVPLVSCSGLSRAPMAQRFRCCERVHDRAGRTQPRDGSSA